MVWVGGAHQIDFEYALARGIVLPLSVQDHRSLRQVRTRGYTE